MVVTEVFIILLLALFGGAMYGLGHIAGGRDAEARHNDWAGKYLFIYKEDTGTWDRARVTGRTIDMDKINRELDRLSGGY